MASICPICTHPQRSEIERAMIDGESGPSIAARFKVRTTSVNVHRAKHLPASALAPVHASRAKMDRQLIDYAIARKAERIRLTQAIIDDLTIVKNARAKAYAHLPGGESGIVDDRGYLDREWIKQMLAALRQVACEMGEWRPGGDGDDTGRGGAQVVIMQSVSGELAQTAIGRATDNGQRAIAVETEMPQKPTIRGLFDRVAEYSSQSVQNADDGDDGAVEVAGEPEE